ncbi:hypothetical protein [Vagococcus acidifermentans]|uniref:Uncharacterized protein n=1 Tax=Vagococcus acidifermentans TaxID=564710 RepID=A0A430ANW3_9ENTE|nr:hypothetical protein [Vagococcus acidifermentans]RSU09812.1 hypothetical protein CBF27_12065 [Vagococcus acidifermentans]
MKEILKEFQLKISDHVLLVNELRRWLKPILSIESHLNHLLREAILRHQEIRVITNRVCGENQPLLANDDQLLVFFSPDVTLAGKYKLQRFVVTEIEQKIRSPTITVASYHYQIMQKKYIHLKKSED